MPPESKRRRSMNDASPEHNTRAITLLHIVLCGGLATIGVAFLLVMKRLGGPLLRGAESARSLVGYVTLAIALALLAGAIMFIRARLRPRPQHQSLEAYWALEQTRGAAMALWVVCDMAGIIAAVGYILSGWLPALAGTLLAFAVLVAYRPSSLTGA